MTARVARAALVAALVLSCSAAGVAHACAQEHAGHGAAPHPGHEMFMRSLGSGWHVMGMSQVYPIVTVGFGNNANEAVRTNALYLTQPVLMANLEAPSMRIVLRTTVNFEGVTQEDGELTFGAWGEGFLDRRHPHTLLHEAMLSANFWDVGGGALSLSAGKGFAPYGTDDPMARPVAKFPTNHHLLQILERFLAGAAYRRSGWSIEAAVFGGSEPTGPYDFSNIEDFPSSWSARIARRFGGTGLLAEWELSASYGHVVEVHDDAERTTRLVNGYVRHDRVHHFGHLYALVEASLSEPAGEAGGYWSVLGEAQLGRGRHQPYVRLEVATRPEYVRAGVPGSAGFYRYDHDAGPIGATRWFIAAAGYNYHLTRLPFSARPFLEVQFHNVANERGDVAARELFGTTNFFALTTGARLYFGGGPMRMGSYGVLDAMTELMRAPVAAANPTHHDGIHSRSPK
jgi:hypothetical protein